MSILITNEEFPHRCWGCPCCSFQDNGFAGWDHYCNLLDEFVNDYQHSCHKLCPLVEVPEFSSDLIERDAVLDACEFIGERNDMEYLGNDNYAARYEEIEKIPAIIRKEE